MADLKSIKGVEIFAAGRWNGDEYSVEDLDEMVRAFEANKATLKPSLKLGHAKDQTLLQKDGLPAAGWVSNVYRQGKKLVADFVDLPNKIYELIEKKAYRKVSSEVFWNIEVNGQKYKRMLSAVALLGGDMPAVGCLDDILNLYGVRKSDSKGGYSGLTGANTIREYTLDLTGENMEKTDIEVKLESDLKAASDKNAELEAQVKKFEQDLADKAKEAEELRKFKAESDAKAAEAELDKTVVELEKDGLVSPAMKPYIKALLGAELKEYALGEKKIGKSELVRETLKLHKEAATVNFSEKSKAGSGEGKDKTEQAEAEIQKYAADNKCSYKEAYKAVMKNQK